MFVTLVPGDGVLTLPSCASRVGPALRACKGGGYFPKEGVPSAVLERSAVRTLQWKKVGPEALPIPFIANSGDAIKPSSLPTSNDIGEGFGGLGD